MMETQVTRLTKGIFQNAYNTPNTDFEGYLQFIDSFVESSNGRDVFKVILSDGFSISNFIVNPRIGHQFEDKVKLRDILRVKLCLISYRDYNQLCVEDFSVIYYDNMDIIGHQKPFIPHLRTFTNNSGSCDIPIHIIERHGLAVPAQTQSQVIAQERPFANQARPADTQERPFVSQARPVDAQERPFANQARPVVPQERPVVVQARPVVSQTRPEAVRTFHELLRKREVVEPEQPQPQFNKISDLKAPDRSWIIKARVLRKFDLRPLRNNKGKFFTVLLADDSGQIRANFFKKDASNLFNQIKEGDVYTFTGGQVEMSIFNTTISRYEIAFGEDAELVRQVDDKTIPSQAGQFLSIAEALKQSDNTVINVLAMIKEPGELEDVSLRAGGSKKRRLITLIDASEQEITLRLWEESASRIFLEKDDIYIFNGLKVRTYNNEKYLAWEGSSKICHDVLDDKVYEDLAAWRNRYVARISLNEQIQPVPYISDNVQRGLLVSLSELNKRCHDFFGVEENRAKNLIFEFTGFISHVSRNVWYEACGFRGCSKKVLEVNGEYYCDKCNRVKTDSLPRFMADVKIVDGGDYIFGRMFGEENCITLFGKTVFEIKNIRRLNEDTYMRLLKDVEKIEFCFRVNAKMHEFNGEEKLNFTILSCSQVEQVADSLSTRMIESMFEQVLS